MTMTIIHRPVLVGRGSCMNVECMGQFIKNILLQKSLFFFPNIRNQYQFRQVSLQNIHVFVTGQDGQKFKINSSEKMECGILFNFR